LPAPLIGAIQDELSKGVDLCQTEFAEMLPLGAWFPDNLPKLFVHHQIHFVYAKRFLDTYGRNCYSAYLEAVMKTQEQAWLQHFDGVITLSEQDRNILIPGLAAEKLFTSPSPIPSDVGVAQDLPPEFDGRFLFVASEEHSPNRDGLQWMLDRIWPQILQQLPASRLVVVGSWSESAKAKLVRPHVTFSGFVTNLPATLRGGIMLVPLRIGSGVRVKILAAMAQGVPVVSTSIGSEGIPVSDGEELMVRDGAAEFAAAAVQLARNPELWRRLSVAGHAAMANHYSPERVRQQRNEIYAALLRVKRESLNRANDLVLPAKS
jgi:glycosyltransferase involved in cell wall biosynthesis